MSVGPSWALRPGQPAWPSYRLSRQPRERPACRLTQDPAHGFLCLPVHLLAPSRGHPGASQAFHTLITHGEDPPLLGDKASSTNLSFCGSSSWFLRSPGRNLGLVLFFFPHALDFCHPPHSLAGPGAEISSPSRLFSLPWWRGCVHLRLDTPPSKLSS